MSRTTSSSTSPPLEILNGAGDVPIPVIPDNQLRKTGPTPIIRNPSHDPIQFLSDMLDPLIAASAMLAEEFKWSEAYVELIDIFRHAPKPADRMAALDRLMRLSQSTLIAKGAIARVTDTAQIRSPDGTTASREVITRQLIRSFEKDTDRANPDPVSKPALPDRIVGEAEVLKSEAEGPAPSPQASVGGAPSPTP